jgi:uncharacterized membrane protein (DUF106 family)
MPTTQPAQSKEQMEAMQKTMRTQLLYFFIMILLLFVYTTPILRYLFSLPMIYILQPFIGFNFQYPLFTILLASLITGIVNTVARHFFMDYFKMAEMQFKNKKLSTRYREAIRTRNKQEIDAVRAEQSKSMQDSMQVTQQQMKPTFITLILSVLIFAWMIGFMDQVKTIGKAIIVSPFGPVDLMHLYYGFYLWIAFYSLFTIIITYPLQYGLKLYYLKKSINKQSVSA